MLFQTKTRDTIDAVTSKLSVARQELEAARDALKDRALEIAMSADPWEGEAQHDKVRRCEERVSLLTDALDAAEGLERQKQAQKVAELRATQNRAIAQHKNRMVKFAREFEKGVGWLTQSFDQLVDEGGAIHRLLPSGGQFDGFARSVAYKHLFAMATREMERQGGGQDIAGSRLSAPGCRPQQSTFFHPKALPTLTDDLGSLLERHYDALTGRAPSRPEDIAPQIVPTVAEDAAQDAPQAFVEAATAPEAPLAQVPRKLGPLPRGLP